MGEVILRLCPRRKRRTLRMAFPHQPFLRPTAQFLPSHHRTLRLDRLLFPSPCHLRSTPCHSRAVWRSHRQLCTLHRRLLLRTRLSTATTLAGIPSASTLPRAHLLRGLRRPTACKDRHHLSTRTAPTVIVMGWVTTDEEASANLRSPQGSPHACSTRPAGARTGN